ncbi:triadin-like [Megalops cyprinoides]|uniref:triadin-like n=1 Tax=Megalops cyprinoides TaxID=118141 RepID=UPI001864F9FF|nr:triadin-like [Megalops cyprinoides]
MTEAEGRSTTTTTVIDSKNGDVVHPSVRVSKKTVADDLYTTFSSPMAWLLVLALIITWSAVAVIMFDLLDYKSLQANTFYCDDPCLPPGSRHAAVSKAIKDTERPRGGIQEIGSDPMKVVNDAVEESTDWMNTFLALVSDLLTPDEEEDEEGDLAHAVRKKGELLPSKKKERKVIKPAKEIREKKEKVEKKEVRKEIRESKAAKEEKEKKLAKAERKTEKPKKKAEAVEKRPKTEIKERPKMKFAKEVKEAKRLKEAKKEREPAKMKPDVKKAAVKVRKVKEPKETDKPERVQKKEDKPEKVQKKEVKLREKKKEEKEVKPEKKKEVKEA